MIPFPSFQLNPFIFCAISASCHHITTHQGTIPNTRPHERCNFEGHSGPTHVCVDAILMERSFEGLAQGLSIGHCSCRFPLFSLSLIHEHVSRDCPHCCHGALSGRGLVHPQLALRHLPMPNRRTNPHTSLVHCIEVFKDTLPQHHSFELNWHFSGCNAVMCSQSLKSLNGLQPSYWETNPRNTRCCLTLVYLPHGEPH